MVVDDNDLEVESSVATVTVWLTDDATGPLHDGKSVEYNVKLQDGEIESFQSTAYVDGNVEDSLESSEEEILPENIRDEVRSQI